MRIARPVLLRSTIEIQPWILSLVYQGTNRAEVPVACQGYGYCFPSLLSCLALLGLFDRRGLYFLGDPSRSLLQLTLSTPPGSFSGEAEQEYPRSTGSGTSSYCRCHTWERSAQFSPSCLSSTQPWQHRCGYFGLRYYPSHVCGWVYEWRVLRGAS